MILPIRIYIFESAIIREARKGPIPGHLGLELATSRPAHVISHNYRMQVNQWENSQLEEIVR
jgi:hypothetical protein